MKKLISFCLILAAMALYGQGINSSTQSAVVKIKFASDGGIAPAFESSIVLPSYPATQQQAGEAAEVEFELTVDEKGEVSAVVATRVRAMDPSKSIFETCTIRAVESWKFRPSSKQGNKLKYPLKLRGTVKFQPVADIW